jgi:uncharacterized membrane protein (DUF106 family)
VKKSFERMEKYDRMITKFKGYIDRVKKSKNTEKIKFNKLVKELNDDEHHSFLEWLGVTNE